MSKLKRKDSPSSGATCLYGEPGAGKTALALDLANHGFNVHLLDLEHGSDVAQIVVEDENFSNVDIYEINDGPTNPNAIKLVSRILNCSGEISFCVKHSRTICKECEKDGGEFEHINAKEFSSNEVLVIDSATQLISSAVTHSSGARKVLESKKLDWDNWNDLGQLMDFVFAKAQKANFPVIFIAHELTIPLPDGSQKLSPIGGTLNYSRNFTRFFNNVIRCSVKNGTHRLQSLPKDNTKAKAKNRFNLDINECENGLADILKPSPDLLAKARKEFIAARAGKTAPKGNATKAKLKLKK